MFLVLKILFKHIYMLLCPFLHWFNHIEMFLFFLQKSEFQFFGRYNTIWAGSEVSCKIVSIAGFLYHMLLVQYFIRTFTYCDIFLLCTIS